MDNYVDERDYKIIEGDKYTFTVFPKIISMKCQVLFSDHKRLIIAFTGRPFPAWIWCADDASTNEMETAYKITTEALPLTDGYFYIMKYNLAEYFIQRSKEEGKALSIKTNMLAYDCQTPIQPSDIADGELHQCDINDIDEIVEFTDLFHKAIDMDQESLDTYRKNVEENIDKNCFFFWKNKEGKAVASCRLNLFSEPLMSVGAVYTKEEYRRKHYAQNLVYHVTMLVKEKGYIPTLYTDADYVASNACYEKIGYTLKGKVCRLG